MFDSQSLRRIRWVVFDAVGTLIFADPPVHMAYHRLGQKHGSKVTPEQAARLFREALGGVSPDKTEALKTDETLEREFWRQTVGSVLPDVNGADACFGELFDHFARPSSWGCFADVEDTLSALRSFGLELGMASNFDGRLHAVCDGHPALAGIRTRIVSSEAGWKKPDRRFFEAVVEKCGVAADEVLVVGDDWTNDVVAAREAGLAAWYLDRSGGRRHDGLSSLDELIEPFRIALAGQH